MIIAPDLISSKGLLENTSGKRQVGKWDMGKGCVPGLIAATRSSRVGFTMKVNWQVKQSDPSLKGSRIEFC